MFNEQILEFFNNKKILITGGTGLIGIQVIKLLLNMNAMITVVSLDDIKHENDGVNYVIADLRNVNACNDLINGYDYVFHLAGIKGSVEVVKTKPASFFVPYLQFNTNVLEACRINNVKKIIYTSSIGAYEPCDVFNEVESFHKPVENPMDMYPGWAKRMAELQIQSYKTQYGLTNFATVRPCNVYGPGDNFDPNNAMVIPSLMHKIVNGNNPVSIWGDGSAIRDFAYSKDVAEGIILALYYGTDWTKGDAHGNFVNLGSGKGITIKELVETMNKVVSFNYEFDTTKSSGWPKRVMDITLAKEIIHYNPTTTLYDGLKETWEWFTQNKTEYLQKKNYFVE